MKAGPGRPPGALYGGVGGRLPYLVLPTNEKNDAGLYGENTYLGPLANAKNGAGLYGKNTFGVRSWFHSITIRLKA